MNVLTHWARQTWQDSTDRSASSGLICATAMRSKCGLAWCASNASWLVYAGQAPNASGCSVVRSATKSTQPGSARLAAA